MFPKRRTINMITNMTQKTFLAYKSTYMSVNVKRKQQVVKIAPSLISCWNLSFFSNNILELRIIFISMVELIITFMIYRVGHGVKNMMEIPSQILLIKNQVRYCDTCSGRLGFKPSTIVLSGLFLKISPAQQLNKRSLMRSNK